jgi:hypothetical protein
LPSDFLLPLFVLTLLANAILVAFAIRGMRRGQWDDDRPIGAAPRPPAGGSRSGSPTQAGSPPTDGEPSSRDEVARAEVARAELARAIATRRPPADVAIGSARSVDTRPPVETLSSRPVSDADAGAADPAAPASGARRKGAPAPKPRPTGKPAATANAPATKPAPTESRRGRRRFSLPPLDDDHEKVNRSIKSFLGGIEGSGPANDSLGPANDAPNPPATDMPRKGATAAGPTTVALIAVDGLPADSGSNGSTRPQASPVTDAPTVDATSPAGDALEPDVLAEALAMVERTLRAAARGSDVVTIGERGRFRIVLPATGELAARAYLRRIRATIEPRLESAGRPLRLAVATATVLDESLDHAVQRAEHRLSVALASDASLDGSIPPHWSSGGSDDAAGHPPVTPRAAAD